MADELQVIDDSNMDVITGTGTAVLMLSRSDCDVCHEYEREISQLMEAGELPGVDVVGKMVLDQAGSSRFKRENPWVAELRSLPHTVLFYNGEQVHRFGTSHGELLKEQVLERQAGVGR